MNDEFVRSACIGYDWQAGLRKVNDKYMLSTTLDMFVHDVSLGLIDMKKFFDPTCHEEELAPYDNARFGLPTNRSTIYPTIATETGFELNDGNFVLYEDVEEYDFEQPDPFEYLENLGIHLTEEAKNAIVAGLCTITGTVSIPIE